MCAGIFARNTVVLALLAVACAAASKSEPDLRLIQAIKEQGGRGASTLVGEHIDINTAQPDGATALAWAAYLDQAQTVDLLLKAGAKTNTADEYGETPLTLACATGDYGVIEKLIQAGADAKAARWNGETALMIASRSGTVPGVKLLIEHGADVNASEGRKGQNALMWAAAEGHCDVIDLLLARGADVKTVSKGGFTPLVFAAQKGDSKSVSSLLKAGLDPNYVLPSGGIDVLQIAVAGEQAEAAKVLLENGANPNAADRSGNTPLHIAAQAGDLEIVKALLAKSANPNAVTAKTAAPAGRGGFLRNAVGQQTPLFLAARANHKDVMEALVAAGADPKLKAQDGSTLLMAAAGSAHLGPVEYAFALAPDISAATTRKSTVMHAAVSVQLQKSTQLEVCNVIQFLADKGADLDAADANGRTPLVIADFLPIDKAVTLLTKLIVASGATPKIPSKR